MISKEIASGNLNRRLLNVLLTFVLFTTSGLYIQVSRHKSDDKLHFRKDIPLEGKCEK